MDIFKQQLFLTLKDHSVSGEEFLLYKDEKLDLVFTSPQPEDLNRYYESADYISHTDGKRTLFEKAYHLVKSYALNSKQSLVNKLYLNKGTLLDLGAGTGDFLAVMQKNGWNAIGVEPNEKAKAIADSKGVRFVEQSQLLEDYSIDVITMWHVLEHVPDLDSQIKELKRLLKPDGLVLIAVPNFNSYDAKHYKNFWAAYDAPRHLWHFSKTAIEKLFEREKLQLVTIVPMVFDAFYVSLLSEKYKTGKMNLFKAFVIGLKSNCLAMKTKEYSSHIYILKNNK